MTELHSERLVLRPPRPEDRDDLFAVFSNPEAMRYWSKPPFTDPKQIEEYINAVEQCDPAKSAEFVVEYEGRVISKAGFWRVPEIGYILHPDFWRQGLGYEALRALIDHGFDVRGMERITADVDPDNISSIRLLTKLGFVETGREKNTLQIEDAWFDSVYFAVDHVSYKKARQN